MDEGAARRIEEHARRFVATPSHGFPALRASGAVDLPLLRHGALGHPNPKVRRWSLTLLDHLDGDASVPTFLVALRDPVPRVRRHALHALVCERCKDEPITVDVVPALVEAATTDESPKVRALARAALRPHAGDPRAVGVLATWAAG